MGFTFQQISIGSTFSGFALNQTQALSRPFSFLALHIFVQQPFYTTMGEQILAFLQFVKPFPYTKIQARENKDQIHSSNLYT